ncbi:hypothetical protein AGIG_G4656 [Arapaima gigas]
MVTVVKKMVVTMMVPWSVKGGENQPRPSSSICSLHQEAERSGRTAAQSETRKMSTCYWPHPLLPGQSAPSAARLLTLQHRAPPGQLSRPRATDPSIHPSVHPPTDHSDF